MSNLTTLPDEILLEIFKLLSSSDLLALTLVNKHFNSLITNSSQLTHKFELRLTLNNYNREWIVTDRKYSLVFIDAVSARHFLYILAQIGNDVKDLIFNCEDTDVVVVKNVLLMCPNVVKLWLYNLQKEHEFFPAELGEPRPSYELDLLYFQGSVELMKLLQRCQTKRLEVRRIRVNDEEHPSCELELTDFLKHQKNLTDLRLRHFHANSNFLLEETLSEVPFKLTKLRLKYVDNYVHFEDFLANFKDSLTHLDVDKCHHNILNLFTDFKALKNLKISHFCSRFEPLPSIESLSVAHVDGNFSSKFPNVKNLTVHVDVDDIQQIEKFSKLESLKFVNCKVPELKIPPIVRKLTLDRVTFDGEQPFNFENLEIHELQIIKGKNCDWLTDFLTIYDFRLKKLRVVKSFLSDDVQSAIIECHGMIKSIQVVGLEGEIESDSEVASEIDFHSLVGDEQDDFDDEEVIEGNQNGPNEINNVGGIDIHENHFNGDNNAA